MRTLFTSALLGLCADMALAHAVHGMGSVHWHATDLFLPLAFAVAAAAVWFTRKK